MRQEKTENDSRNGHPKTVDDALFSKLKAIQCGLRRRWRSDVGPGCGVSPLVIL